MLTNNRIGGVVGEANIKFFIQFCFYAALYTFFLLVVVAVFVAKGHPKVSVVIDFKRHPSDRIQSSYRHHWAAVLGLAAVFFVFTGGMTISNMQHLHANLTTVDAIDAARRVVYLAIRVRETDRSPELQVEQTDMEPQNCHKPGERKNPFAPRQHGNFDKGGPLPWTGTITYPLYNKSNSTPTPRPVTFAVVKTPPGLNPWDLGFINNVKSVMGRNVLDWFLPLRISPEAKRAMELGDRGEGGGSMYPMGSQYEDLKRRAGIGGGQAAGEGHGRHDNYRFCGSAGARQVGGGGSDGALSGDTALTNVHGQNEAPTSTATKPI